MKKFGKAGKIGLLFAGMHLVILIIFAIYMRTTEPLAQLDLYWGFWFIADFPVSLIWVGYFFIIPESWEPGYFLHYFTHGFLGTVWWYFLAKWIATKVLQSRAKKKNT